MSDPNEFFLSSNDPTPMYGQIIAQVTAKVLAGDWVPGQAIPSIRHLASASKVSWISVCVCVYTYSVLTALGISQAELLDTLFVLKTFV